VVLPRSHIFQPRHKSLARGVVLTVGAFAASLRLAGFPDTAHLHSSPWQYAALLAVICGTAETARCLRRKWSLYHAGVLILLYSDLMILASIIALIVFA
jgi:hypothetical protein